MGLPLYGIITVIVLFWRWARDIEIICNKNKNVSSVKREIITVFKGRKHCRWGESLKWTIWEWDEYLSCTMVSSYVKPDGFLCHSTRLQNIPVQFPFLNILSWSHVIFRFRVRQVTWKKKFKWILLLQKHKNDKLWAITVVRVRHTNRYEWKGCDAEHQQWILVPWLH